MESTKKNKGKAAGPVRSDRLLRKKYTQYLIPAMITYAALSLNEFVDSMLVSNLLDSDAMGVINLGLPVVLVMSAAYAMLGEGGANQYAVSLGKRDHESAGKSFTAAVIFALIIGFLILIIGMLFETQLGNMLCDEESLRPAFNKYFHVLLMTAPITVVVLTITSFLPAAGHPGLSTAVNVIANVVNIFMDYIYIRVFGMGVEGAAWATITGYAVGAVFLAVAAMMGKIDIHWSRDIAGSLPAIKEITRIGRPDAMNQIGLSVQFAVCNKLVMTYGGADGEVAFSLCLQAGSVISIFVAAVAGTSVTLMAVLHGQQDYKGEEKVLKNAMLNELVMTSIGVILFEIFAANAAAFYNITEPAQLAMSVHALRIYSLMFVPRYLTYVFYNYLKVIGLDRYSTVLSALDSFAAVIPAAWIMTKLFGLEGFWWSFLVASLVIIVIIVVCNHIFTARSGGRLRGLFVLESEADASTKPILDVTISKGSSDISYISEKVQRACEESGLGRRDALKAALAAEEIAVYVANKKQQSTYADMLVRIRNGNVEIDFRSLGEVFDPMADEEGDIIENVKMLRSVASSIQNEYVLGMNSVRITIEGHKGEAPEESLKA